MKPLMRGGLDPPPTEACFAFPVGYGMTKLPRERRQIQGGLDTSPMEDRFAILESDSGRLRPPAVGRSFRVPRRLRHVVS